MKLDHIPHLSRSLHLQLFSRLHAHQSETAIKEKEEHEESQLLQCFLNKTS